MLLVIALVTTAMTALLLAAIIGSPEREPELLPGAAEAPADQER